MPAATAEVAHATVEGCHRLRRRVQTAPQDGQILMAFRRRTAAASERLSTLVSDSDAETPDAARGAATKSGGWRSSGTLSCQSKPMVDEPVFVRASLASLSTPTTCKAERQTASAAFCAAHKTHLAGVTDGAGGVRTPRFCADCRPGASPEGCSRPGVGVQAAAENGE